MPSKLESTLGSYLKEIKQFELLSPEEERELASRIRAASDVDERFARGEVTLPERERIERKAAEARDRMIQANLRLVISVAKNFRNRGLPMEDLVNEGNVGLVHAVDRFDPAYGSRFSTYASYWIDQAIRRALQNATQMIHIPAYLMEHIGRMKLATRALEEKLGRPPTLPEIAEQLGITRKKARVLADAIRTCTTPMQGQTEGGGSMLSETVPDPRAPSPFEALFTESDTQFVRRLLHEITDREAEILKLRYGLHGGKRMTLKEVGDAVGLTRERVRQIEQQAKDKLVGYVQNYI